MTLEEFHEFISRAAAVLPPGMPVTMNTGWDGGGDPVSIVVAYDTVYINHEASAAWNGPLTELAPGIYRLEPEQKEQT